MAIQEQDLPSEGIDDWLRRCLIAADELLRPEVSERIREQGAAAVAPLIQILEDRTLLDVRAGGGWAPIHAAVLLGEPRVA